MNGGLGLVRPGPGGLGQRSERGARGRRFLLCLIPCLVSILLWWTAVHASGGGAEAEAEGPSWLNFIWRAFNFAVLVGALYWLLADKARAFFVGRREGIKTALTEAATARSAAEAKFREYSAKLDQATGEIEQISQMIQAQGLAEKERLIADARKAADKIREDTQARMKQELSAASKALQVEAVRLSAEMAEELLKKHIRAADHEAMVSDTIEKLGSQKP